MEPDVRTAEQQTFSKLTHKATAGESACTAPGAEFRKALTEFRAEHHRHCAALARIEETKASKAGLLAEIDQLEVKIRDLLAEDLRRDLGGG